MMFLCRRWQSSSPTGAAAHSLMCENPQCLFDKFLLSQQEASALKSVLRRVLRLARWIDTRPEMKVFLSHVCLQNRQNEENTRVYSAILRPHLQACTYAIPLPGRSLSQDFLRGCHHLAQDESHLQPLLNSKKTRLYDVLIGAFLLGLRQLRWIQSLSDADAAVASELETVSDEKTGHWSTDPIPAEDLHWLTSSQYANGIRPGTFLIAHPLASGIWKQTVILITRVHDGRVNGVIVNKKPSFLAREKSLITRTFVKTLRGVCSMTRGRFACSRTSREYAALLLRQEPVSESGIKTFPSTRGTHVAQRTELRRLWKRYGSFGGPVPEIVTLYRGNPQDALRTVIPGCVACGKTRHRAPPSEQLALSASDKLNPPSSTAAETRQPSFPAPSLPNERHFVGLTAWGVSQLEDELREGHWLAFTTENASVVDRIVWTSSEIDLIWRTLLRAFSEELYNASQLPSTMYKKATEQIHRQSVRLPDLAAFLAPFLNGNHTPIVISNVTTPDSSDDEDDNDETINSDEEFEDRDNTNPLNDEDTDDDNGSPDDDDDDDDGTHPHT